MANLADDSKLLKSVVSVGVVNLVGIVLDGPLSNVLLGALDNTLNVLSFFLYLWNINIALTLLDNASPVHDEVIWGEANISNAALIASIINFKSLKEFRVLFGNWLDGLTIVSLDLFLVIFQDLSNFFFIVFLVLFQLFELISGVVSNIFSIIFKMVEISFDLLLSGLVGCVGLSHSNSCDTEDCEYFKEHLL